MIVASGHIFQAGYSLCWPVIEWTSLDRFVSPDIRKFQSIGLTDDGMLCEHCVKRIREAFGKPKRPKKELMS